MYYRTILGALLLASSSWTLADLKPDVLDCDPKKAGRNAAMQATVGVSGKCNAKKAANEAKKDVTNDAKDKVDEAVRIDKPIPRKDSNGRLNDSKKS